MGRQPETRGGQWARREDRGEARYGREFGDIEGLRVLDPAATVQYYMGRWRTPLPADTGDFVARRPQAYGADLWCCVRLEAGLSKKMIEFPVDDPVAPARDEAWRVQMAIDAARGLPQRYRLERMNGMEATVVSFFSPIPGFAERHLQLLGMALPEAQRALFAFRVPNGAIQALTAFLNAMLWMPQLEEESR